MPCTFEFDWELSLIPLSSLSLLLRNLSTVSNRLFDVAQFNLSTTFCLPNTICKVIEMPRRSNNTTDPSRGAFSGKQSNSPDPDPEPPAAPPYVPPLTLQLHFHSSPFQYLHTKSDVVSILSPTFTDRCSKSIIILSQSGGIRAAPHQIQPQATSYHATSYHATSYAHPCPKNPSPFPS
jgi:hypothetical protein